MHGCPSHLRPRYYTHITLVSPTYLPQVENTLKRFNERGRQGLQETGLEGEILRDISRTFPSHELFKVGARGQDMLSDVLK